LTEAESRYAQIEKELLGLTFACIRFDEYIYGLPKIELETDHRPLVAISRKLLNDMPPRLQRMMIKLQRYDFEMKYTPGKFLYIPDTLSRAKLGQSDDNLNQELDSQVNMIVDQLNISAITLQKIAEETDKDHNLRIVKESLQNGWCRTKTPDFYDVRDTLTEVNGMLLKDDRIVIPYSLREIVLKKLHDGHFGLEKIKALARKSIFWPKMSRDIETMSRTCSVCQKYRYRQQKETLITDEQNLGPWQKVASDLFEIRNKNYLLVIDYYSNYPEVVELTSTNSTNVIKNIKEIFSRHGIPQEFVSDNGMQYASVDFK
jgi:hypothetical protein